jgi:hypothetical protein
MKADLPELCRATHAIFLAGWEKSKGAEIEHYVAVNLGIKCAHSVAEFEVFMEEEK